MNVNSLSKDSARKEIHESVSKSVKLVDDIVEEINHLAAEFRIGVTPELSLEFDECLSAIQTLMASMMTLQFISKKDEALKKAWVESYKEWETAEKLFKSSLNAMLKAYGHEDYLGLSDIMDEELRESLLSWRSFITKVENKL